MSVTETSLALAAVIEREDDGIAWSEGFVLNVRAYLFDYADAFVA